MGSLKEFFFGKQTTSEDPPPLLGKEVTEALRVGAANLLQAGGQVLKLKAVQSVQKVGSKVTFGKILKKAEPLTTGNDEHLVTLDAANRILRIIPPGSVQLSINGEARIVRIKSVLPQIVIQERADQSDFEDKNGIPLQVMASFVPKLRIPKDAKMDEIKNLFGKLQEAVGEDMDLEKLTNRIQLQVANALDAILNKYEDWRAARDHYTEIKQAIAESLKGEKWFELIEIGEISLQVNLSAQQKNANASVEAARTLMKEAEAYLAKGVNSEDPTVVAKKLMDMVESQLGKEADSRDKVKALGILVKMRNDGKAASPEDKVNALRILADMSEKNVEGGTIITGGKRK